MNAKRNQATPHQASGRTQPEIDQEPVPRLPHERDESSDSQDNGKARPIIEKAHDDVASGRVDTDRSKPMDETYQKQKK